MNNATDFKDDELNVLIDVLIREGFQPYLTSVGGSGLGILSPYAEHRTTRTAHHRPSADPQQTAGGPVTPPETPTPELSQVAPGKQGEPLESLRPVFETASVGELAEWTTGLGRWLYV